ncbi:hypothetical protein GA0111570_101223 [Raineyella antarctica]|uniref:Uncharacterized protein n=1 Tax=Raineyella antarctica TaxID=1577474 RepID=A0A1G6GDA5_9ACTN|nr:hypothetical protein [Raineyella antarctica]SDB79950.1 hypothetical protein GA0111570_101223 [Raineyella antarctica]
MVLLEYNGGAASGPVELIVIGVLALAIVLLGLLLMHSLKKIKVPYADETGERSRSGRRSFPFPVGEDTDEDGPEAPTADGDDKQGPPRA